MMTDPREGALDDPALGQNDKSMAIAPAHDLRVPRPCPLNNGLHFRALISGVADQPCEEGEHSTRLSQQGLGAVPILNVGSVHDDAEQETERVGQNVTLSANHLLVCVVAGWIERRAPFCADFAVWLSIIASVGLASRPARSRSAG